MKPPVPRLEVSREELGSLLEHARSGLSDSEYQQLRAALDTLVYLTQLVEDKSTTIARLRQILFGATTEKTNNVVQTTAGNGSTSVTPEGGKAAAPPDKPEPATQPRTWAQRRRGVSRCPQDQDRTRFLAIGESLPGMSERKTVCAGYTGSTDPGSGASPIGGDRV